MMTTEQQEALLRKIETLEKELSSKDKKIAILDKKVTSLEDQLLWFRRKYFGKMSEKHLPLDPAQLLLFDQEQMTEEEKSALAGEVKTAETTITKTIAVKEKPTRRSLDTSNLPVEEIHIYPDGTTEDVMFWYDRGSRGYNVAGELLGGYRGMVQSDGYEAYDQFEGKEGITMYGCWAHARRKFTDALDEDNTLATEGICYIRKLYKVESDADEAGLTPDERKERRLKESYPVLQTFEKWLEDTYSKVLPKSRMSRAISYTYSLLPRLSRYVNDGRVHIDNNLIENAIRPLAIGRKNYLFCGNDASAYRAAIVYSLIGTCKSAGIDPRLWMEDVLRKIPYYQQEGHNLEDLLPRAWADSQTSMPLGH